ncbi:hypothetical protein GUITHDRAFT_161127 [Guillardia theta CCMP2712]|uniref:Uncharacterized protein n=1 Tax=Guillardia theta (strain CCMP2712) TaxID=905079 RepID=L1JXB0_GUITC|nr:hypothetical protein GUITHDRAFT_161127 [Guillardia theta CCMP2712]EKX52974.1 hypothetical protein GUITHDRAFT_161127 [Guillardia theta CCMP2712]|eukprot:XP_005839954.1 hypothetical protein GUITHDRAFT_161127 [Guillardia theta CCMP2712]
MRSQLMPPLVPTLLSFLFILAAGIQGTAPLPALARGALSSAQYQIFVPSPLRLQGGRRSESRKRRPDGERSESESRRSVSPSSKEGEPTRSPKRSKGDPKDGRKIKKHIPSSAKKIHNSPLPLAEESTEEESSQEQRSESPTMSQRTVEDQQSLQRKKKKGNSSEVSSYKTPSTKRKKAFHKTPDSGRSVRFSESLTSVHEYPSKKQKFCTQEEIERAFQESIEEEMLSELEEEQKPKGKGRAAPMWEESSSETRKPPKDSASMIDKKGRNRDKSKRKGKD